MAYDLSAVVMFKFATASSNWGKLSKVTQCMALCEIFDGDPLLLPAEFFTVPCKIGWDWINPERCYSQKLNMADRVIEYL